MSAGARRLATVVALMAAVALLAVNVIALSSYVARWLGIGAPLSWIALLVALLAPPMFLPTKSDKADMLAVGGALTFWNGAVLVAAWLLCPTSPFATVAAVLGVDLGREVSADVAAPADTPNPPSARGAQDIPWPPPAQQGRDTSSPPQRDDGGEQPSTRPSSNADAPSAEKAREALRGVVRATHTRDLAEHISNESAAAIGVRWMRFQHVLLETVWADDRELVARFDAVFQRYGLVRSLDMWRDLAKIAPAVRPNGRQFLVDASELLIELTTLDGRKESAPINTPWGILYAGSCVPEALKDQIRSAPDSVTVVPIDDRRVRLVGPRGGEGLLAILEDGRWRVHLGDFLDLASRPTTWTQMMSH